MNSLGFEKSEKDTRVVVAMSGGVDSSCVAALLKEQGYDVIGITLQLYDHGAALQKKGACCAGQDIYDARNVAQSLNFPHYVLDYESKFSDSVMNDFADSYLRGETPIPCVRCNQTVKFRDLLAQAKELGADCLATGHYIRRVVGPNGAELHRAHDADKDQSYFLFATTDEQLDFLRFPLGGMSKAETRAMATRFGLAVADKPDSQDICFVPNGSYADVVKKLRPEAGKPGDIVTNSGDKLGEHHGTINYTIGQRKGLGIGGGASKEGEPLYVLRIEPHQNRVIVGDKKELARDIVHLKEVNWLGAHDGDEIWVKLRSTGQLVPATMKRATDNTAVVTLTEAQYGVAPGQACVFYDGPRVLGGGWIHRTGKSDAGDVQTDQQGVCA